MAERQPRGRPRPDEDEVGTPAIWDDREAPRERQYADVYYETTDQLAKLKSELVVLDRATDASQVISRIDKVQILLRELRTALVEGKEVR